MIFNKRNKQLNVSLPKDKLRKMFNEELDKKKYIRFFIEGFD